MKQVKIIKKKDDYTMEYEVGDICKVTGTWYGGVHIEGKTGIPVSIDREEYIELDAQGKPEQAAAENVRMDEQNGHSESMGDEAAAKDVLERDIEVGDTGMGIRGKCGILIQSSGICTAYGNR